MHLNSPLPTSITLLALAIMPLAAADLTFSEVRLGVGMLSTDYEGASSTTVTAEDSSVTTSRSSEHGRNADNNWRGQLQYVGGNLGTGGGLIWGAGLSVNRATWDNGSQDAHVTTPTINVLLGYGYAFTPTWHVELTPFGGYGRAYYSVNDNGSPSTSDDWDNYIEYGGKIGTYYAFDNTMVVGVEVPYLIGKFDPEYTYTDTNNGQVTATDERRNEGFGVLATLGMRF